MEIQIKQPILKSYEDYGCKLNHLSVKDLFQRYNEAGFLYPEKLQRLLPYMPEIAENWRRTLRGGELLNWVATYEDEARTFFGAVSVWRSTHRGWIVQHLISNGSPLASRAVMLAGLAVRINDSPDNSLQNWFQPTNKFANKIFGSMSNSLERDTSSLGSYSYVYVPILKSNFDSKDVLVRQCNSKNQAECIEFVRSIRGDVYVAGEELNNEDLNLEAVDELYNLVGLRRYRRVFVAYLKNQHKPIGAAIAWRGPLGLNFSFIENRCDLLIAEDISEDEKQNAVIALLQKASQVYEDFPPQVIPVIVETQLDSLLIKLGGEVARCYSQSIWLRAGFESYYRHVEHFYERIIQANKRRGFNAGQVISEPTVNSYAKTQPGESVTP